MAVLLYATLTTTSGSSDRPQGGNRTWYVTLTTASGPSDRPQGGTRLWQYLLYVTLTTASGPSGRPQGGNRIWQYYCMLHSPQPMAPQIGPRVVTEYGSITVCYTHHSQCPLR